jgi:hypothetical protein
VLAACVSSLRLLGGQSAGPEPAPAHPAASPGGERLDLSRPRL